MAEFLCNSEKQLPEAAEFILREAGDARILLFEGLMGSGKTSLIKALCGLLGSKDHFSSPSFSLVNEYQSSKGKLFHFDLYRLNRTEELYDIGVELYLDSGQYCFVEWPELIKPLLEQDYLIVHIVTGENASRKITTSKVSAD